MTIKKIGHSCIVVETKGVRFLFDPGVFSKEQNELTGLDAVIITHVHADHYDVDSIKQIRIKNPNAIFVTNHEVGALLTELGIPFEQIEDGGSMTLKNISIEAYGSKHEFIYQGVPEVINTGYVLDGTLYHPGDAYHVLKNSAPVLALPVTAPWGTLRNTIDYAKTFKPKVCFPVHDATLKEPGLYHRLPKQFLEPAGIDFKPLWSNQEFTV